MAIFRLITRRNLLAGACLAAASLAPLACMDENYRSDKPVLEVVKGPVAHEALEGTVGEIAFFADSAGILVTGYGVVGNLPDTGSRQMPPAVREILATQLYRRGAGMHSQGTSGLQPDAILDSTTIAAVEVRGVIPPFSRKGSSFDIYMTSLPGSQTTSLERGVLWTADLKVHGGLMDSGSDTAPLNDSQPIATGEGAIYCRPAFDMADATAGRRNLLSGRAIGGGYVQEDQKIRLQLRSPSDQWTRQIEHIVTSRWPSHDQPYAAAQNNLVVDLRIPPEYEDNPAAFVDLVLHLYFKQEFPGFAIQRAGQLVAAMDTPHAPYKELSLALEGLGRGTLDPVLRPAYTSPNPLVRFWTARAGANMLDAAGVVVLQQFADAKDSPLRFEAIRAIGDAGQRNPSTSGMMCLLRLLDDSDTAVRIAAYEALANMRSDFVHTFAIGRNYVLDVVPSHGAPLIYATQAMQRRIALLGSPAMVPPSVLYISPDHTLTVSAIDPNDHDLTDPLLDPTDPTATAPADAVVDRKESVMLRYQSPMTKKVSKIYSTNSLASVIARLGAMPDIIRNPRPNTPFIGASYQQVIEMLGSLAKDDLVNARFILQPAPKPLLSSAEVLAGGRQDRNPESVTTRPAMMVPTTTPETGAGHPAMAPVDGNGAGVQSSMKN